MTLEERVRKLEDSMESLDRCLLVSLVIVFLILFFTSCATQPRTVIDGNGYAYQLVQPAIQSGDFTDIELWERVAPLDTNHWYTPSLDWQLHPTNQPSLKAVMK